MSNYRWRICALLFFATTINYIDRQVLGLLAPFLQKEIGWSEAEYGYIVTAFHTAYAIGLLITGNLIDKFGIKIGLSVAMTIWSVAGMAHSLASSALSFGMARFGLAFGESANFPASIKTVAEWFPKKERALATGIFNSGSNIGAIVAPIIVPLIALKYGWQWAFIITGSLGFLWLVFWLPLYRSPEKHPGVSAGELTHIKSDPEESVQHIPWKNILPYRQTIGICLSRFITDPIWWFFLYWLPKFLNSKYGLDISGIGIPLIIIYTASSFGSIGGGWLSSHFIKKGKSIDFARKTTVLIVGLMVLPIFFASYTSHLWVSVLLISLATSAHQGWGANIFTIVSDIFPKNTVGSVIGLSGFCGAVGGMLFAPAVGLILQATGNYYIVFGIASLAYITAWLILKIFIPRIEPLRN